jgi:hypothetical protein
MRTYAQQQLSAKTERTPFSSAHAAIVQHPEREVQKRTGMEWNDEEQKGDSLLAHDFSRIPVSRADASTGSEETQKKKLCKKADLGSLSAKAALSGDATKAGVDATITVKAGAAPCACDQYRWLQVADIIPGKWNGRDEAYVDPFPNDDTKPYFWTDSEEASSPNTFTDPPKLLRSRATTEGKAITNKFETACMCLQAGKNDRVIGAVNWGYTFTTDLAKDKLIGPSTTSGVSSFWKKTVAKDFGAYKYDP